MATRFYLRRTSTWTKAIPENGGYQDMTILQTTTGSPVGQNITTTGLLQPDNSKQMQKGIFYSERFTQAFTLSGAITVSMQTNSWGPSTPLRGRYKISKITAGGGMVETPILSMDGSADIAVNVRYTVVGTPPNPVDIAPGERLILRVYMFPPGGVWGTGSSVWQYDAPSTLNGVTWIELTETASTQGIKLYTRRTTTIATATPALSGYLDLLTAKGTTAFTTGVVSTTAGATEKQWTQTSGGALLHWVTPRFAAGWSIDATNQVTGLFTASESNASANCGFRMRILRRQPSGVETSVAVYDNLTELLTSGSSLQFSSVTSLTPTAFDEDDRLVLRVYIVPASGLTMGGGFTCSVSYDHNSATEISANHAWVTVEDIATYKAETDPARVPPVVSGTSTLGIGNGQ